MGSVNNYFCATFTLLVTCSSLRASRLSKIKLNFVLKISTNSKCTFLIRSYAAEFYIIFIFIYLFISHFICIRSSHANLICIWVCVWAWFFQSCPGCCSCYCHFNSSAAARVYVCVNWNCVYALLADLKSRAETGLTGVLKEMSAIRCPLSINFIKNAVKAVAGATKTRF